MDGDFPLRRTPRSVPGEPVAFQKADMGAGASSALEVKVRLLSESIVCRQPIHGLSARIAQCDRASAFKKHLAAS